MSHEAISKSPPVKYIERILFNVRWMLIPFYFGLVAVLVLFGWGYFHMILDDFTKVGSKMEYLKILALDAMDAAMMANLIKMVATGSYNSFVSKGHGYANENVSSGMLKIKILTSVILIMVIHLLKMFMDSVVNFDLLYKNLAVFGTLVVTAPVLALIEYLHQKGEEIEDLVESRKESRSVHVSRDHGSVLAIAPAPFRELASGTEREHDSLSDHAT